MKYIKIVVLSTILLLLSSCKAEIQEEIDLPPSFNGAVNIEIHVNTETEINYLNKVSLYDVEDGEISITESMIDSTEVQLDVIGTYSVYYEYADSAGNVGEYTLIVRVIDRVAPIVSLVGLRHVFLVEGSSYTDPGVNITDNYYNTCDIIISGDTVDFDTPGIYEIDYSCIDGSDNPSNIITRTIEIVEYLPLDFQIGDQIFFNGYFKEDVNAVLTKPISGIFYVRSYNILDEYSIGVSETENSDIFYILLDDVKDVSYINTFEEVSLDVGLLHQFDYTGYLTGSDMTISGYGCALTAATMVINYWNETTLTPQDTNPDIVQSGLVYWSNTNTEDYDNLSVHYFPSYEAYRVIKLFTDIEAYNLLKQRVKEKIDEGIPVIINIKGNTTHYVVGYGYYYNDLGELVILINDPGSSYRFELDDVTASYPFFFEGFIYYEK